VAINSNVTAFQARIVVGVTLATAVMLTASCGSSHQSTTSQAAAAGDVSGPHYPSPPVGDSVAYESAFNACDDGITAEEMCRCMAAKLSERSDAASLDYPTLLDYNNPNPPGFLLDISGSCEATP
jgi:hypothetical protein